MKTSRPEDLGAIIGDLQRRLRALETSPRVSRASIEDGALVALDAEGRDRVRIGRLEGDYDGDLATDFGIEVLTPEGRANFRLSESGFVKPATLVPMAPSLNSTIYTTGSAAYQEVARVDFDCTSSHLTFDVYANPNVVTMDLRFVAAIAGQTPEPIYEQTGIAAFTQYAAAVDLRSFAFLGADVIGQYVSLRLELRRTAGALDAAVRFNAPPMNRLFGA